MSGWQLIYTPHQLITELLRALLNGMEEEPTCVNKAVVYCVRSPDGTEYNLKLEDIRTHHKLLAVIFSEDRPPALPTPPARDASPAGVRTPRDTQRRRRKGSD